MKSDSMNLILGGTGKIGRRVVARLKDLQLPVRVAGRSSEPRFDWDDQETWAPVLKGVKAAYIAYAPELGLPGAAETVRAFCETALHEGVHRLVLLSGRGEPRAQRAEEFVAQSGADWTVVRASFFAQNFSEGIFADELKTGTFEFVAGDVREPFIDAEDVADVAVAALTQERHAGQIYEVTGPRLMSFADTVHTIGQATGRQIRYNCVPPAEYQARLASAGFPPEAAAQMTQLFVSVLDGRNSYVADGVPRALGRQAKTFSEYAAAAAASGAWSI